MSRLDVINGIISKGKLDIRLEVILADLLARSKGSGGSALLDVNIDSFLVKSNSRFKRNYHNDIEEIEEIELGVNKKNKLCFVVNRNGIYDALPEGLFHLSTNDKSNGGKDNILEELEKQNKRAESARQFFLPFEQEFYRQRIKLEAEERNFLFETNGEFPDEQLFHIWSFPGFLDGLQKSKLCVLMPVLNNIVGDWQLTTLIMESLTGDSIELKNTIPLKYFLPEGPVTGETRLGVDCILGGEVPDTIPSITIKIHLHDLHMLEDYMTEGKQMKLYYFLSTLFFPLEYDIVYELELPKSEKYFTLDNETESPSRLNYTTII